MNPFNFFLPSFSCNTLEELYSKLEGIAQDKLGLQQLPFPMSALENEVVDINIYPFILRLNRLATGNDADSQAKELIEFLKNNTPEVSHQNPKMPDNVCPIEETGFIEHITYFGIDLPGSKHNPFGSGYFSNFFMDIFFGNFTDFMVHVNSLSRQQLNKELEKREGYCQFTPLFAPILGLKVVDLDKQCFLSTSEKRELRIMYAGNNENRHLEILTKLLVLGADPNAYDINGYTLLDHALLFYRDAMVTTLLEYGANPNFHGRNGKTPFSFILDQFYRKEPVEPLHELRQRCIEIIDVFLKHGAKLVNKTDANKLRASLETYGSKELAVRVREAHPREEEECEKCLKPAPKKCSACGLVYYCTPACQKLDWSFHKVTCKKIQENKKME